MSSLLTRLECEPIIVEAIESVGCKLYALFLTPGKSQHLTILIEKDGGVDADDCENVFDQLRLTCLRTDPHLKNKSIEVATPGVDRPLLYPVHFQSSLGRWIDVQISAHEDQPKKTLRGYVLHCNDETIELKLEDDTTQVISYNIIAKGRWLIDHTPPNREKA